MAAQFLIEMPAEGAARLLTLSLLEPIRAYADAEDVLRDAMWSSQLVPTDGADDGRPHATPARLQRGLIVLAQTLHDEAVRSFDDVRAVSLSGGIDRLGGGIGELAMRLRQS
jgi:hypothetical protein